MGVAVDFFSEGDLVDVPEEDDETTDDDDATDGNEASLVWWDVGSNRLDVGRVCIGMVA